MRFLFPRTLALAATAVLALAAVARPDAMVPGNILDPKTPAEAWNVIRLATKNVDQLLTENRLTEIPVQISYCSPALRAFSRMVATPEALAQVDAQTKRAFVSVNAIALAAMAKNPGGVQSALASLRRTLEGVARHFDPKAVGADIFFCPLHSDFLSENPRVPCPKCGMELLTRRIPYSFIYMKPGEPTMSLTAIASAPVEAGKKIEVKVRLAKVDKSPVVPADLLVIHTERIHLLIEEPALGDYHRVHPTATATPGEYAFSFTPRKTAPYRIWADLVPVATGVQELPFADLPSGGAAGALERTEDQLTTTAGGYRCTLSFSDGKLLPTKAREARSMSLTITDAAGQPVATLEPVMNAFAHLVGFYDDYRTVVHLHPTGGEVLDQNRRGGPTLGFMLFAPKPGFLRLYCQVSIGSRMLFAPFGLNVQP